MANTPLQSDVTGRFALDSTALAGLKAQAKKDPQHALAGAASQFEALFMQMMLKSMREALPQGGPLTSDSMKSFTGMLDQQMAQVLSKKGVGLSDMLMKQLQRALPSDTTATAPKAGAVTGAEAMRRYAAPAAGAATINMRGVAASPKAGAAVELPPGVPRPGGATGGDKVSTIGAFIERFKPIAESVAKTLGVPAQFLLAQAGLETGWGKSQPRAVDGVASRNLFGIKAGATWKGASTAAATTEYSGSVAQRTSAQFRTYGSYADSFQDFGKVLQGSRRYADALANTHDAGKYAASLQRAGYATDPHYAEKLKRAIDSVARYLPAPAVPAQVAAAPVDKTLAG